MAETEQEPSIEEILESIRQIISEDDEGEGAENGAEENAPEVDLSPDEEEPVDESDLVLKDENEAVETDESDLTLKAEEDETLESDLTLKGEEDTPLDSDLDLSEDEDVATADESDLTLKGEEDDTLDSDLDLSQEDDAETDKAGEDDVLELTELVEKPGEDDEEVTADDMASIMEGFDVDSEENEDLPDIVMEDEEEVQTQPAAVPDDVERLISDEAAAAASGALASLTQNAYVENDDVERVVTPGRVTLEDITRELMKPMIKEWLDAQLPDLVERLVQKEIEKITKDIK